MSSEQTATRTRILQATWQLLEQHQGQGVKMIDIAKLAGISRQAVYLHFPSRTELMIATLNYVDDIKGLNERMKQLQTVTSGTELLETCVDIWCHYIPEIYGLAKAMLLTRDSDDAVMAAWNNSMDCLRAVCQQTIDALAQEGMLAAGWSTKEATDMFMMIVSIQNWEQLTIECGWSLEQYITGINNLLKRALLVSE